MTDTNKRIVEINGIKLEIDMTTAKVVEEYRVGDCVKVLIKGYGDTFKSHPGVIIGFNPFVNRPTIVVSYLETDYNTAGVKFLYLNQDSKDVELCPMLEHEAVLDKGRIIDIMNRNINKLEADLADANAKKAYFLREFGNVFKSLVEEA